MTSHTHDANYYMYVLNIETDASKLLKITKQKSKYQELLKY